MERISYDATCFSDLAILHFSRYCFASHLVKAKRVLDVGCGEGFGSNLLSEYAKSVTGCDVSAKAVSSSESRFGNKVANFLVCDGTKLPFSESRFDVVVAFEVIEHVKNSQELLNQICTVLENRRCVHSVYTPAGCLRITNESISSDGNFPTKSSRQFYRIRLNR